MNTKLQTLFLSITTAFFFSAFIYFVEYKLTNPILNSLFSLIALGLLLKIPKKSILGAGFFIGLFWFYWIGYSFEYQGVGYLTPFITIGFGFIYMLFFAPLALTSNPILRALMLFGLSFVEPFDWNWLQIELLFVDSYFGVEKYQLFLILLALSLSFVVSKKIRFLPLLILISALNLSQVELKQAPLKIKLVQTEIKQEEKWKREKREESVEMIFNAIDSAIKNSYDVIVLPESVFPFYLNQYVGIINQLKKQSFQISIVCGSLLHENNEIYNVTYMFENGTYTIAKKVVLVPFGEYIPLPKFARKFINDTFFAGGSDFISASKPTDFIIKGIKFRNAICYEATCEELYEGDPTYMIATSNNAWFAPSIEPTIQRLLMRYYAKKHNTIIYHSANYAGSGVVW